jgi:hypothetical protein
VIGVFTRRRDAARSAGAALKGVVAIADAAPSRRWRVEGAIEAIGIDPRDDEPSIEVRVGDGTGWLVARWVGWSSLRGLALGKRLALEAFVDVDVDGCRFMLQPEYEIVPGLEG